MNNFEKCNGCLYYSGEIDQCMYGEDDVPKDMIKKCHSQCIKEYKDDDVFVAEPGDIREKPGYSGAFCKCGCTLHIKTPQKKDFYTIKCPNCSATICLFCGLEE